MQSNTETRPLKATKQTFPRIAIDKRDQMIVMATSLAMGVYEAIILDMGSCEPTECINGVGGSITIGHEFLIDYNGVVSLCNDNVDF